MVMATVALGASYTRNSARQGVGGPTVPLSRVLNVPRGGYAE